MLMGSMSRLFTKMMIVSSAISATICAYAAESHEPLQQDTNASSEDISKESAPQSAEASAVAKSVETATSGETETAVQELARMANGTQDWDTNKH